VAGVTFYLILLLALSGSLRNLLRRPPGRSGERIE
jgi:hypothetical protein